MTSKDHLRAGLGVGAGLSPTRRRATRLGQREQKREPHDEQHAYGEHPVPMTLA